MKKVFLILLVFLEVSMNSQTVKSSGALQVIGTQLSDEKGNPIELHGMSFGWSCFHPRFYTPQAVKWLKQDWNCNVVRASMGIEPDKGYLKDSITSEKIMNTVIKAAIKEDIYVIIDWHSHNIQTKEAKAFFDRMSKKYANRPNVIYEIFNEPDYESWKEVKEYAIEIIQAIRKNDPDNIILVGSPTWDQDIHLPAEDPITGEKNIMYTVHFYAGTHKQWLRDRTDAAIKKGIPVFISESAGMEATGDGPIDYKEWDSYVQWIRNQKLSWITWSVSDKDESCSVLNTSASSKGNWKEEDIKASGLKTREYLKQYSNTNPKK